MQKNTRSKTSGFERWASLASFRNWFKGEGGQTLENLGVLYWHSASAVVLVFRRHIMEEWEASISGTARRVSRLTAASEADVSLGGTALLVVDPQMDFHEGGSLAVPGASADAKRIARLITDQCQNIDDLIVTLDSHHVSSPSSQFP